MDPQERMDDITDRSIDLLSRRVFLFGSIDNDMALQLEASLTLLEQASAAIKVVIQSEGGEESAGFGIYDRLLSSPNHIVTFGRGAVMSIATLIFQGGDERILTPECRMMVHSGSFNFGKGDIQQSRISDLGAEMRNTTKRYADIIAERSGLDPRKVRSWCRGDRFFGAQEALDLGLADGISTPRQRSSK